MTVKLKAYDMRRQRGVFCCVWAFVLLLGAEYCPAETGFLALAVEAAPADISESKLIIPDLNSMWNVDSIRAQKEKKRYRSSKPTTQNMYLSAGNAFVLPLQSKRPTDSGPQRSEASASPLGQFLFMVFTVGLGGFALIVLGTLKFWRNRRVKNIRLFPTAEISSQPFPVAAPGDQTWKDVNQAKLSTKQTDEKFARGRAA
jgi:hypothetical protein